MREIKFRAWDSYQSKMYSWAKLGELDAGKHLSLWNLLIGEVPLIRAMQYTGLKDMKGVEIYEGDVVSYSSWNTEDGSSPMGSSEWKAGDVYFVDGKFAVRGNELWDTFKYRNIMVIGNIHQSPELLKESK